MNEQLSSTDSKPTTCQRCDERDPVCYRVRVASDKLRMLVCDSCGEKTNGGDKMTKQAYSRDPRLADVDIEAVRVGYEDTVLASLQHLPHVLYAISDLRGAFGLFECEGFPHR